MSSDSNIPPILSGVDVPPHEGTSESLNEQKIWDTYEGFKGDIPKPNGDPYDYFLKSWLERDAMQCSNWKEEVQNTLIFAGLFSAVVTAFIVESYQRLRPDPSDVMVGLLSRISEQLDLNPPTRNSSLSTIMINGDFVPSRSDVRVNILWFISLVLSLTVAFIGTITLQWLREHQRYNHTWTPQQRFAVLNARTDSLQRWYVPQIFASLPLLLQGALVLFLGGIVEFLFALQSSVAIPVTLAICLPLTFLVATTFLPTLQHFIMNFPHVLSINDNIPSQCPYKSPQSLIARRIAVSSTHLSSCATWATAIAYLLLLILPAYYAGKMLSMCYMGASVCGRTAGSIISAVSKFVTNILPAPSPTRRLIAWGSGTGYFESSQSPTLRRLFRHRAAFRPEIECYRLNIRRRSDPLITRHNHEWTALEEYFLGERTSYATVRNPPRIPVAATSWDHWIMDSFRLKPTVYDCVQGLHRMGNNLFQGTAADGHALYHCADMVISQQWSDANFSIYEVRDKSHLADRYCRAFAAFLQDGSSCSDSYKETSPLPSSFMKLNKSKPVKFQDITQFQDLHLTNLFLFLTTQANSNIGPQMEARRMEIFIKILQTRLNQDPPEIFEWGQNQLDMIPVWLFNESQRITHFSTKYGLSAFASFFFHDFLRKTSHLQPNRDLELNAESQSYGGVLSYSYFVVHVQSAMDINDTLVLLRTLLGQPELCTRARPFLLLVACVYVEVIVVTEHLSHEKIAAFRPLLELICSICGNVASLKYIYWDILEENVRYCHWEGYRNAIKWIHDQNRTNQATAQPEIPPTMVPLSNNSRQASTDNSSRASIE